jgi:hypothetical protein
MLTVPQGLLRLEGLCKLKKIIDLIGTRTLDLPECTIVSQSLRYRVSANINLTSKVTDVGMHHDWSCITHGRGGGATHSGNTPSEVYDITETELVYNNLIEFSVEMIPSGLASVGVAQLFCGLSKLPGDRPTRDIACWIQRRENVLFVWCSGWMTCLKSLWKWRRFPVWLQTWYLVMFSQ